MYLRLMSGGRQSTYHFWHLHRPPGKKERKTEKRRKREIETGVERMDEGKAGREAGSRVRQKA